MLIFYFEFLDFYFMNFFYFLGLSTNKYMMISYMLIWEKSGKQNIHSWLYKVSNLEEQSIIIHDYQ